ncbi:hypothetical protein LAZ67_14001733 [Cordylochernes scorpioides]|uniref:Transposase Tc1-like domain-containing protein n=1 Tax=Cordylochernes scorpioides TaxID=51811 RepID=A0ABY6L8X3_9ARAC|nr:hypothetical protein LAZ67_14001733 [Cordylochernes scorpioides]
MPRRKIRAHYEHMSEFETGRAIGLKEAGWSNRLIALHLCRSDAAIRRCWQKWINNGRMQRQDGSGRPRATTEREDRAIVRMAVQATESTLSTIQRVTGTQVSKMTINRRLREWNLRARRPLRCLPLTPVHRQVRLQWCRERLTWNCADWGRIVFSDESRFLLFPDDRRKRVWRRPGQRVDPGLTVEHHTCPQQGVMARLLNWFKESENARIKRLITGVELGNMKPSQLLQKLRAIATPDISEKLIRTLWLHKLTDSFAAILLVSDEDVNKLAAMADKITDMTTKSDIYDINHDTNKVILDKISELERQISQINVDHYSRGDNRQSNSARTRSRSRSNRRFNPNGKLCYYHYRFGKKCLPGKCVQPCGWEYRNTINRTPQVDQTENSNLQ